MIKRTYLLGLIFVGFSLAGCNLVAQPADMTEESPTVTLSGTLTAAGGKFTLATPDRKTVDLDSRQVDLSTYSGKQVTVSGQYSGTTLFVSTIQ